MMKLFITLATASLSIAVSGGRTSLVNKDKIEVLVCGRTITTDTIPPKTVILQSGPVQTYDSSILSMQLTNTKGQPIRLNSIMTKYILLDFWSPTSEPSRNHNKTIQDNLSQIEEKGLITVVAVALDDEKENNAAYKADKLSYLSINQPEKFNSPLASAFGINQVPYNVIIDKKGTVVARNTWGDELLGAMEQLR